MTRPNKRLLFLAVSIPVIVAAVLAIMLLNNQDAFLTEENKVSQLVKHQIIDKYANQYPWLTEVWAYTNRPEFKYSSLEGGRPDSGGIRHDTLEAQPVDQVVATELIVNEAALDDEAYLSVFIHELAHVYTLATDQVIAQRPGTLAIAHLYFERLARTAGYGSFCIGSELYADAIKKFVDLPTNSPEKTEYIYWNECQDLPTEPTEESLAVAGAALAGEMPQWFYDTFQLPDGSIDHQLLWAEVRAIRRSSWNPSSQKSVIYQLKDEFGGYCSDISDFIYSADLKDPWQDGGCQNLPTRLEFNPPAPSLRKI